MTILTISVRVAKKAVRNWRVPAQNRRFFVTTHPTQTLPSLGAGDSLWLHFGLGDATISKLHIRWPDGTQQNFDRVPANRRITLAYPLTDADRTAQRAILYGPQRNFWPWLLGGIVVGVLLFFAWKRSRSPQPAPVE